MAYRNKVFVCFDGDSDMHYYRLMRAWKQNDRTPFNFHDAHDLTQARDTSSEATIKASLQMRLRNAKTFVVLIGSQTRYLYRFVRWEMEQALRLQLPIIGVNLNMLRSQDPFTCPPVIRNELVMYVSFNPAILQFALEHWAWQHSRLKGEGRAGPYYYPTDTYRRLGL